MEVDVVAESSDGPTLLVEVRKRQTKSNAKNVQNFQEKVAIYQTQYSEQLILASFLSLGGFTEDALALCQSQGIAWSTELRYF